MARRRRARRLHRTGGFRLFLVFAVLVGINVYVFFYSPGSLRVVAQAAETASMRRPALLMVPAQKLVTRQGTVREREGLGAALRREGLAVADVDGALRALRPLLDFRQAQRYTLTRGSDGHLAALELRVAGISYAVHRAPDGRLLGGKAPLAKAPRVVHH